MNEFNRVPAVVIGYILKLVKNKIDISEYKKIFNCIKHTNYDKFINLVKIELNYEFTGWKGISSSNGILKDDNFSTESGDCDFVMLLQSIPSLKEFYSIIIDKFGNITDNQISEDVYHKLALFELYIRMAVSNIKGNTNKEDLVNVIDELCDLKGFTDSERELLQIGRKFLNDVKRSRFD